MFQNNHPSSFMSMSRAHTLDTISEIVMPNGHVTRKLDFLGTIRVYGKHYFNVWRRYNNVYEIVIEDFAGDFHFHKDYTIRESIQKVLCLSNEQIHGLYTIDAISFKHRADVSEDVTSMRWTEIEHRWYALDMNVGGILHDFHGISNDDDTKEEVEQLDRNLLFEPNWQHATNDVVIEPSATSIPLTERFSELTGFSDVSGYTVLRNGNKISKP
jgi:hypothetical protein